MNTIYRGVLALIKSALTDEKIPVPDGFSLEQADDLVINQSLTPMVYRGALNCGVAAGQEIMRRYQVEYFRHLVRGDKQTRAAQQVFDAFEKNGIDYMPMKGCNLKKLYLRPEMRVMGDADVLIRLEQYDRIRPIMKELGFEDVKESPYDFCWQTPELYIELHKRLYAPSQVDLCGYFGDGWSKAHRDTGYRYAMTPEDEYVYVFTHMAKHFRGGGIGARQLVDLYVYRCAHPELKEDLIEKAMEQLGLTEFYHNIRRMLLVWFDGAPEDEVSLLITDYIFSSGNWGSLQNKLYIEKAAQKGKVTHSRGKSLMAAIFPPLSVMRLSYPVLNKWAVLYPVYWVIRCVDILLHKRGRLNKRMDIIRNMSDDKVEAYRAMMDTMGIRLENVADDE